MGCPVASLQAERTDERAKAPRVHARCLWKHSREIRRGVLLTLRWPIASLFCSLRWLSYGDSLNSSHLPLTSTRRAFDEAGMYIRKKDEFAHHDNWLQGTSKEDIEKV